MASLAQGYLPSPYSAQWMPRFDGAPGGPGVETYLRTCVAIHSTTRVTRRSSHFVALHSTDLYRKPLNALNCGERHEFKGYARTETRGPPHGGHRCLPGAPSPGSAPFVNPRERDGYTHRFPAPHSTQHRSKQDSRAIMRPLFRKLMLKITHEIRGES